MTARSRTNDRENQPEPCSRPSRPQPAGVVEEIEVRGHIVDSLLLPKILDRILLMGGTFEIRECKIGVHRTDPSYARIAIQADSHETARRDPGRPGRARGLADASGRRHDRRGRYRRRVSRWVLQHDQPGDPGPGQRALDHGRRPGNGLRDRGRSRTRADARCIPMARVEIGMPIVVGHAGVRVLPIERSREVSPFGFMNSTVSSEKPKSISVKGVVDAIRRDPGRGEEGVAGGGAGDRAHRLGGPRRAADQGGLGPGAVRRQRPGDPRHRTGAVRHEPGRLADARRADRAWSRASPARDQHHPPAGGNRPGGRRGRAQLRESCTSASRRASTWSWPARFATTARCPR